MTQTTTHRGARSTAATAALRVIEIDLGRTGKTLLDKFAGSRMTRLLAERAERPSKERLKEIVDSAVEEHELQKDEVIVVKAMGVVRGKISIKDRGPSCDYDLLMQAFPEAYAACVTRSASAQFDPA